MASHAAAHGCGSAFVRRTARFDTGWRLRALVAESGRRAVSRWQCSARGVPVQVRAGALHAPGSGDRAPLVRAAAEAGTRRGLSLRGGLTASRLDFGSRARRSESGPRNNAFVALAARAPPWYGGGPGSESRRRLHADVAQWSERDLAKVEAPGSRLGIRSHAVVAQQVERLLPKQDVAGSKPVSRSQAGLAQRERRLN
jgi:hypothetical protein